MSEKPRESLLVEVLEMHQHSGTVSLPTSDEAKGAGPPQQLKSLLYGKGIHPTSRRLWGGGCSPQQLHSESGALAHGAERQEPTAQAGRRGDSRLRALLQGQASTQSSPELDAEMKS